MRREERIKLELKKFEEWCYEEEELCEATIESYLFSLNRFFEVYPEVNNKNVIAWKETLKQNFSPKTVNIRLNGIRKYAVWKEIPLKVKTIKIHKTVNTENVINFKQYKKVLKYLKDTGNIRWYVNVVVLARTGARASEAIRIRKSDLLRGYAELYTKGKYRRIYIPKSLVNELKDYVEPMKDSKYLIQNCHGEQMTTRGLSSGLRSLSDKWDVPKNVMHPHSFRHFFAIEFMKRNGNVFLLADLLGHSGVNTTMIYARLSGEQQQQELDKAVNW